jgi:hypothetical protein
MNIAVQVASCTAAASFGSVAGAHGLLSADVTSLMCKLHQERHALAGSRGVCTVVIAVLLVVYMPVPGGMRVAGSQPCGEVVQGADSLLRVGNLGIH